MPVDVYGRTARAIVPDPTDLAASKLARLSEKDRAFVAELLALGLVPINALRAAVAMLPVEEVRREAARQFLDSIAS